jgi:hypothetical protein
VGLLLYTNNIGEYKVYKVKMIFLSFREERKGKEKGFLRFRILLTTRNEEKRDQKNKLNIFITIYNYILVNVKFNIMFDSRVMLNRLLQAHIILTFKLKILKS